MRYLQAIPVLIGIFFYALVIFFASLFSKKFRRELTGDGVIRESDYHE